MKIKYEDGSTGDTDRMDDFSAELTEKLEEFLQFCSERKIPAFCRVYNPVLQKVGGIQHATENDLAVMTKLFLTILSDMERWTGCKIKLEPPSDYES